MDIGTLKKMDDAYDGSMHKTMAIVSTLPWVIRTIDGLCDNLAKTIAERDKLKSDHDSLKDFYREGKCKNTK